MEIDSLVGNPRKIKSLLGSNLKNKTIYLVHGLFYDSSRSLDTFGKYLKDRGYNVKMIYYNPYSMTSNLSVISFLNSLTSSSIVIGHSWGGIISQLTNSGARIVTINTLGDNTLKNKDDWLPAYGDYINLHGSGHSIDTYQEYQAIVQYLETLFISEESSPGKGSYVRI